MKHSIYCGIVCLLLIHCAHNQTDEFAMVPMSITHIEYLSAEEIAMVRKDIRNLDSLLKDSCRLIDCSKDYIPVIVTKPWKE